MYNIECEDGIRFSEDHRAAIICHMIRFGLNNVRLVSHSDRIMRHMDRYDLTVVISNQIANKDFVRNNIYKTAREGIISVIHPKVVHTRILPTDLEIFNLNDVFNAWGGWKDCMEEVEDIAENTDWETARRAIRSQLLGGLDEKILSNRTQMGLLEKELELIDNSTHQLRTLIAAHRKEMERLKKLKGSETPETSKMIDKSIDEIMQLRKSGAFIDVKFTATAVEAVTGNIYINNTKRLSGLKEMDGSKSIGWYSMGRYRIVMPYNGGTPGITSVSKSKHSRRPENSYPHPHVAFGGSPCLGNLGAPLRKFLQEGEYALALSALYEFLGTWSYKSPYIPLHEGWEKVDPPETNNVKEKKKEEEKTKEKTDASRVPTPA